MAVRISQKSLFTNFVNNMNMSLSSLVDLNIQASSQKRVNKPSDDPVGASRILSYRNQIDAVRQYQENVDTAQGWLGLADQTLLQVSTVITRAKELAEQGASGTYTRENREQIAYEARQLMNQLIDLSNTDFAGKNIFSGHKVDDQAYTLSLMGLSNDANWGNLNHVESVSGSTDRQTMVIRFFDPDNTVNPGDTVNLGPTAPANLTARYSTDGGKTWTNQVLGTGLELDIDGVQVRFRNDTPITVVDGTARSPEDDSGTLVYIMPTATYHGDDENQYAVEFTGANSGIDVLPQGVFEKTVYVQNIQEIAVGGETHLQYDFWYEGQTAADAVTWTNVIPSPPDPLNPPAIRLPDGDIKLVGGPPYANLEFTIHSGASKVEQLGPDVNAYAEGVFDQNVIVRVDSQIGTTLLGDFGDNTVEVEVEADLTDPHTTLLATGGPSIATTVRYRVNGGAWVAGVPIQADSTVTVVTPDGPQNILLTGAGTLNNFAFTIEGGESEVTQSAVRLGGSAIEYSYSMDGGASWVQNQKNDVTDQIDIPGGVLNLDTKGVPATQDYLLLNDQFVVHPKTAAIDLEATVNSRVQINNIGNDIFGGMHDGSISAYFSDDQAQNLFVTMGKLVGFLESNNQNGIQQVLEDLRTASEVVLEQQGSIGGRENRLELTATVLSGIELNKSERLSLIEDVDVASLMTKLAQQQLIYESVLKSSSMIMRMSLSSYI